MSTVVGTDGITYTLKTGDERFTTDLTSSSNLYAQTSASPNGYVLDGGRTVTNVTFSGKLLAGGGLRGSNNGGSSFYLNSGATIIHFKNYGALLGGGGGGNGTNGSSGGIGGGGGSASALNSIGGSFITGLPGAAAGGGPGQAGGNYLTFFGGTGGGAIGGNGAYIGGTNGGNSIQMNNFIFGGGGGAGKNNTGSYGGSGGGYGGGNGGDANNSSGGGGGGGGYGGYARANIGGNGGYAIYNFGTITNLYNSQGGTNNIYGPLFYGGVLPTNYYIRLNSQTNYGQFYCTGWSWPSDISSDAPIINIDPASSFVPTAETRFYNVLVGKFTTASMSTYTTPKLFLTYSWKLEKQVAQTTVGSTLYDVYDLIIGPSSPVFYTPATTLTAFSSGTYRHVALTISGNIHTLYLDGVTVATNMNAGNVFSTYSSLSNLFIGSAADLSYGYTGILDDFKIWNRALSATDISAVYYTR